MNKFITIAITALTHPALASIDSQQPVVTDLHICLKQSQPTQSLQSPTNATNNLAISAQKVNLQCFFNMGNGEKTVDLKSFAPVEPVTPISSFILEYNSQNNRIVIPVLKIKL